MKSAAAAFRRLGYHGATVEQIAATLHMKKGNLYYYFHNKEEILFACHQYSLERLLGTLDEVEVSALAPDEKIRRLIVAFVHMVLDELHGTALGLDLEALSPAHLKVILETGELQTLDKVRLASDIAMDAGAHFIKTSTGKVQPAATLPVTLVMLEAIRDHYVKTGRMVGMKPAGGDSAVTTAGGPKLPPSTGAIDDDIPSAPVFLPAAK